MSRMNWDRSRGQVRMREQGREICETTIAMRSDPANIPVEPEETEPRVVDCDCETESCQLRAKLVEAQRQVLAHYKQQLRNLGVDV